MNKFKLITSLLISVMCLSGMALAQDRTAFISLFGHMGIPQSQNDFKDLYSTGYGMGAQIGGKLMNKTNIILGFSYVPFSQKDEAVADVLYAELKKYIALIEPASVLSDPVLTGGGLALQQYTATLMQPIFSKRLSLYALAGTGLTVFHQKKTTLTATKTGVDVWTKLTGSFPSARTVKESNKLCLGLHAGVGVEFKLASALSLFAEGRYDYTKKPNASDESYRNMQSAVLGARYYF